MGMNNTVIALFLYFPEDKTEYIPAAIWLVAFTLLALLTMRFIMKYSRKEAEKAREYEKALAKRMAVSEENQKES